MPRRQGATTARIAVFTDVHANLPALDAALAEIDRLGVDATYHTGDAIGIGPVSRGVSRPVAVATVHAVPHGESRRVVRVGPA